MTWFFIVLRVQRQCFQLRTWTRIFSHTAVEDKKHLLSAAINHQIRSSGGGNGQPLTPFQLQLFSMFSLYTMLLDDRKSKTLPFLHCLRKCFPICFKTHVKQLHYAAAVQFVLVTRPSLTLSANDNNFHMKGFVIFRVIIFHLP